jgi:hypothetical protein
MANAQKKRIERVGVTAQVDMFHDMPRIIPAIPFPDIRQRRVVVQRPEPEPVRRVCITCGAQFEDYTRRPNTVYCRASCKNKMSEIKRDTAVFLLAEKSGITIDAAWLVYDRTGLNAVEKGLNGLGYTFQREQKGWVK